MSWWSELVTSLVAQVREQPFAPRLIITPSAFARRALRVDLAQALAAHDLPVSGLAIIAPSEFARAYTIVEPLHSPLELKLNLLQAFALDPNLLGGRGPRPWRDQLRLAQALLRDDLEAIEPSALRQGLHNTPRLLEFAQLVQSIASEIEGASPLDAAERAPAPDRQVYSLALPPLPKRLEATLARLAPTPVSGQPAENHLLYTGQTPEQLASSIVSGIIARGTSRVALVVLDSSLRGALKRCLDAEGICWTSPKRRGAGFDPLQRLLAEHPLAQRRAPEPLGAMLDELASAPQRLKEHLRRLERFSELRLSGAALIDLLSAQLTGDLPYDGWGHGQVHLLDASSWPDAHYDEVHLVGARRGSLATALGDHSPLLSPADRQLLSALGLYGFDLARGSALQDDWIRAWQEAAPTLGVSWLTESASGRRLMAENWAKELAEGLVCQTPPPATPQRCIPEPLSTDRHNQVAIKRWSPSRIESLQRCARQGYLKNFLKLPAQADDLGLERLSDNRWVGNAVHKIVERAAKPIIAKQQALSDFPKLLSEQTEAFVAEQEPAIPSGLHQPIILAFSRRFRTLIERLESGDITQILAAEEDLEGPCDLGDLSARCDLIIRDRDGHKLLLDLKSSPAKTTRKLQASERSGTSVQRGIYLSLVPDAYAAGMFYLGGGDAPLQLARQGEDELFVAQEVLRRSQAILENGAFAPDPGDQFGPCGGCEHRAACRPYDQAWVGALAAQEPKYDKTVLETARAARQAKESSS